MGLPRNWLELDGSSNHVNVPAARVTGITALTLEAWVKIEDQKRKGRQTLISAKPFELFVEGNWLWVERENHLSKLRLPPRKWIFVAMTWRAPELRLHVGIEGGKLATKLFTTNFGSFSFPNEPFFLGGSPGGNYMNGAMAQVAIWRTDRTAKIQEDMNKIVPPDPPPSPRPGEPPTSPQKDLLGWWPLNEGSGTRVHDHSGHGNHGTIVGDDTSGKDPDGNLLESPWPRLTDDPASAGRVIIQVTRNPQEATPTAARAYLFPETLDVFYGDKVEWLFTHKVDQDDVAPADEGNNPASFWQDEKPPHQNSADLYEWEGVVAAESGVYDYKLEVTEKGRTKHPIDPRLKCRGRRGKRS